MCIYNIYMVIYCYIQYILIFHNPATGFMEIGFTGWFRTGLVVDMLRLWLVDKRSETIWGTNNQCFSETIK